MILAFAGFLGSTSANAQDLAINVQPGSSDSLKAIRKPGRCLRVILAVSQKIRTGKWRIKILSESINELQFILS